MKNVAPSSEPFISTTSTLENTRGFRKLPRISFSPQGPDTPHLSVAASRIEADRGDRLVAGGVMDGQAQAPGMVPALMGGGARLGIACDARLGDQGCGVYGSAPCAMNGDAGSPMER